MSGNTEILSFDTKKFRIRIHKSTIHALGNPKYIDLLVNPEKRLVAVRAHDGTASQHDAHRVKQQLMESDNSYEIYSQPFILKLFQIIGDLEVNRSYRMTGTLVSSEKMAVYSLATVTRIEQ